MADYPMRIPVGSLGTVLGEAQPIWNNLTAGTGATLAANGNSGLPLIPTWPYSYLILVVYVAGAVTGTTPSMVVTLGGFMVDLPLQVSNQSGIFLNQSAALTGAGAAQDVSVGPGTIGNHVVPPLVQVQWAITGTTPSFANVQMSLWGR